MSVCARGDGVARIRKLPPRSGLADHGHFLTFALSGVTPLKIAKDFILFDISRAL